MDAAPYAILRKIAETNTCVELFTAVTLGDILLVRLLIESNADIRDAAVLIGAVEKGHIEIVCLLLDHGCPLAENARRIAIDHGHINIVRLLLELPFDLGGTYFIDDDDVDILQYACDGGHTDIVSLLLGLPLDRGVDPAADYNFALRIACELGHTDIVRLLICLPLDRGVDPAADNNVALRYACDSGHTDIVRLLLGLQLDRRVDPASDNNVALRIACERGHTDIVRMFLDLPVERGVNLKHMTGKEIDVLCYTNPKITGMLLRHMISRVHD